MEKLLTRLFKYATSFIALDPKAPSASSSRLSRIHNQPVSAPGKHEVPFRISLHAPLPPPKRIRAPTDSAASPAAAPAAATATATATAEPPASAAQPPSPAPVAL